MCCLYDKSFLIKTSVVWALKSRVTGTRILRQWCKSLAERTPDNSAGTWRFSALHRWFWPKSVVGKVNGARRFWKQRTFRKSWQGAGKAVLRWPSDSGAGGDDGHYICASRRCILILLLPLACFKTATQLQPGKNKEGNLSIDEKVRMQLESAPSFEVCFFTPYSKPRVRVLWLDYLECSATFDSDPL